MQLCFCLQHVTLGLSARGNNAGVVMRSFANIASKASLVSLQSIPPGCDDEPPNASDEVSLGMRRVSNKN